MRKLLALLLLVPVLAACGDSEAGISESDTKAVKAFGQTVNEFRVLAADVWEQTAEGTTVSGPQEYVAKVGPKIDRLEELAFDLRGTVAGIEDVELRELEQPLTDAISELAAALGDVLEAVKAKDNAAIRSAGAKAQKAAKRMYKVAEEQLPKVEAWGKTLD